jgi:hypothetical protein
MNKKQSAFDKQILKLIKKYRQTFNWNGKRRKQNGK